MARQTRAQRRARRRAKGESRLVQRARARQQQVRPAAQAAKAQTGRREGAPRGSFVRESWAELKKVDWPGQKQVMQGTVVVLIACAIVGIYLWGADLVFKRLVQDILLGR